MPDCVQCSYIIYIYHMNLFRATMTEWSVDIRGDGDLSSTVRAVVDPLSSCPVHYSTYLIFGQWKSVLGLVPHRTSVGIVIRQRPWIGTRACPRAKEGILRQCNTVLILVFADQVIREMYLVVMYCNCKLPTLFDPCISCMQHPDLVGLKFVNNLFKCMPCS